MAYVKKYCQHLADTEEMSDIIGLDFYKKSDKYIKACNRIVMLM